MRRAGMIRGGLLTAAATLAACPALAQDGGVRIVFGFEQRVETGWNVGLDVPETGRTTVGITELSFGITSQTPLALLEFSGSTALVVENSFDTDGTEAELGRPDLRFAYTREVPNALFNVTARYRRDDVDAFDDDISDADADGTRTDYGAALRLETGRTAPLGFAVAVSYDAVEYDETTDPDLFDSEILRTSLGTRLRLSEVMVGTVDLSFSREEEEDLPQTVTETVTATAGFEYAVSERVTLDVALGYSEIETEEFGVVDLASGPVGRIGFAADMQNGTATAALILTTDADEGDRATFEIGRALDLPAGSLSARLGVTNAEAAGTDVIGALNWVQTLPDGEIGVSLERRVSYDDGDDETVVETNVDATWRMDVNPLSTFSLNFAYDISDAPSERVEQAEFGATYRYLLTNDWGLDSGVRYIVRDDLEGRAESPLVFIALNRSFEFRP
jgi:hypothetical protein